MKTLLILSLLGLTASPAFARYLQTTASDGKIVVTDSETKLQWTYDSVDHKTWQQAMDYCEGLSYGDHSDWSLPNKNELVSLLNEEKSNPASDFPNAGAEWFWSSSSYEVDSANNARYVVFYNGRLVGYFNKAAYGTVRCVRP